MIEVSDLPLCARHYREVGIRFMAEHMPGPSSPQERAARVAEHRQRQAEAQAAHSQVYYLRIGDRVKIGRTQNVRQRLIELRVDVEALLATEPGGAERERERHLQFAAERVGRREDFNPSRRLLAHIEAVVVEHGPPNLTGYVHVE